MMSVFMYIDYKDPVVDLGYDVGYLAVYNGALYFSADGGDGTGVQLWRYNSP